MRAARPDAARWLALALAAALSACGTEVVRLEGPRPDAPAVKPACISVPMAPGFKCVYCGEDYSVQRACTKCQQTTDPDDCGTCFWSDQDPGRICKSCVDASGGVTLSGCDELRTDLGLTSAP